MKQGFYKLNLSTHTQAEGLGLHYEFPILCKLTCVCYLRMRQKGKSCVSRRGCMNGRIFSMGVFLTTYWPSLLHRGVTPDLILDPIVKIVTEQCILIFILSSSTQWNNCVWANLMKIRDIKTEDSSKFRVHIHVTWMTVALKKIMLSGIRTDRSIYRESP